MCEPQGQMPSVLCAVCRPIQSDQPVRGVKGGAGASVGAAAGGGGSCSAAGGAAPPHAV
jgi:hypothetical protein